MDWTRGKPTVVLPFYSDDEAIRKFGDFNKVTDYLRFVPDPIGNLDCLSSPTVPPQFKRFSSEGAL